MYVNAKFHNHSNKMRGLERIQNLPESKLSENSSYVDFWLIIVLDENTSVLKDLN